MPNLLIGSGRERGVRFEFTEAVTLGRAPENQIRLLDSQISRFHARVEPAGAGWQVVDLGSRNGVRVADERIQESPLEPGDSFVIGSISVYFDAPPEVFVDPSGNGNLVIFAEGQLDPTATRSHSLAPANEDPSETLDLSNLIVARERLEAVLDVYGILGRERNPEELAAGLSRRVCDLFEADGAALVATARRPASVGEIDPPYRPLGSATGGEHGPAGSDAGVSLLVSLEALAEAARRQEGLQSLVAFDHRMVPGPRVREVHRVDSVMAVPLVSLGRVIGLLYVQRPAERPFGDGDLSLLSVFAAQAGNAFESALGHASALEANRALREQVRERLAIVGESPALLEVVSQARRVARGDSTVLLLGETGTGKELVARLVHEASPRHQRPFVAVNCAAIVEGLLESELFGHERGAFTGADRTKKGQFELADGGTFLLDEVGDMDERSQRKLLRVLEERCFPRVGGTRLISVDIRIVAATNRNLERDVRDGRFREDLFYRLSVIPLRLPPLRERRGDISLLAEHFLQSFSRETGHQVRGLTPGARDVLERFAWPGNIRELRNVIERAVVLGRSPTLGVDDLPAEMRGVVAHEGSLASVLDGELKMADAVSRVERECIERALERTRGNKSEACRLLGISRPTLDRKIKDLDIDWGRGQA